MDDTRFEAQPALDNLARRVLLENELATAIGFYSSIRKKGMKTAAEKKVEEDVA